jgi:hypothetical protein
MTTRPPAANLDWDSPIQNDGADFAAFPDKTEVHFIVAKLERTVTGDKSKIGPGCPMAVLDLQVTAEVDGRVLTQTITDRIPLHTSTEWKLCSFFSSIGQRTHGQQIIPNWDAVEGASGRARLTLRTFKKRSDQPGEETGVANDIDAYLEPVTAPTEFAP